MTSPLIIEHNKDLTSLNTFRFKQYAEHFAAVSTDEELEEAVHVANRQQWPIMAIGEGSNLVLANKIKGLVIRQTRATVRYSSHDDLSRVRVVASAGTQWHALVVETLQHGIPGLENLSLIPGTVGAAPVQNIGAYGVELCDRLVSVNAIDTTTGQWQSFSNTDCQMAYRHSAFKTTLSHWIISEVTFELGTTLGLSLSYAPLADLASTLGYRPTATDVHERVCSIRRSKLPDPATVPNAGSFFHNPIVDAEKYAALSEQYPSLVAYPQIGNSYKLAAGWMIDQLGYKGVQRNGVGVHEHQALVLVHLGNSSPACLLDLAKDIAGDVYEHFGVALQIEPTVL